MKKNKRKSPLFIIILLLLLAGMGFLGYHLFNITSIEIKGNNEKQADYIIKLSGVEIGTNIFKINDATLKENIEKDSYLKFIGVEKKYPDKIIIEIKEKVPAAMIKEGNSSLVLDEEGYVLQILQDTNGLSYPVLSGIDISNTAVGKQIVFADEAQRLTMQVVLNAIAKNDADNLIAAIDFININNIKMTTSNGIAVNFGNYSMAEKKILWIKGVLAYDKQKIESGTIDVSTGEFASYKPPE